MQGATLVVPYWEIIFKPTYRPDTHLVTFIGAPPNSNRSVEMRPNGQERLVYARLHHLSNGKQMRQHACYQQQVAITSRLMVSERILLPSRCFTEISDA